MAADGKDDSGLSPEEQMRRAIRGEQVASPTEKNVEPKVVPAPATRARTPMIDRRDEGHSAVPGLRGNPFAVAPPVLGDVDSGAGMGFEFKPRNRGR